MLVLGPLALAFSLFLLPTVVNTASRSCRCCCCCCCCALQSPHTVLPCLPRSFHPIPIGPNSSHPVFGDAAGGPTRTPASFSPSAAFGETQTDSKGLPVTNIDTPTHCRRSASPCSAALKLDYHYCYGAPQRRPQVLRSVELGRRPHSHDLDLSILSIATPRLTTPHHTASSPLLAIRAATLSLAHLLRLHTYPTFARVRLGHSR